MTHRPDREQKKRVQITDKDLRGLVTASTLSSNQRATLHAMADGLNRYDLRITMSIDRISQALGLARSTTFERIRSLESTGVIVKTRGGGGRAENGRGYVNTWNLIPGVLRDQARMNADTLPEGAKGPDTRTDKGPSEQGQGSGLRSATVQPTGHDSTSSSLPKKEIKEDTEIAPQSPSDRQSKAPNHQRRRQPPGIIPWANPLDDPRQWKANRLQQIRARLNYANKLARKTKPNPVHSAKEGES